jgi:hypothetical protein
VTRSPLAEQVSRISVSSRVRLYRCRSLPVTLVHLSLAPSPQTQLTLARTHRDPDKAHARNRPLSSPESLPGWRRLCREGRGEWLRRGRRAGWRSARPVVCERELSFNLELVLQGVNRATASGRGPARCAGGRAPGPAVTRPDVDLGRTAWRWGSSCRCRRPWGGNSRQGDRRTGGAVQLPSSASAFGR